MNALKSFALILLFASDLSANDYIIREYKPNPYQYNNSQLQNRFNLKVPDAYGHRYIVEPNINHKYVPPIYTPPMYRHPVPKFNPELNRLQW